MCIERDDITTAWDTNTNIKLGRSNRATKGIRKTKGLASLNLPQKGVDIEMPVLSGRRFLQPDGLPDHPRKTSNCRKLRQVFRIVVE